MKKSLSILLLAAVALVSCDEVPPPDPDPDPVKVTGITLDKTAAVLAASEVLQLSVTEVLPDEAADKSVTWSSSAPAVADVDQTGLVTAAADGAAEITATANDGSDIEVSCAVTVSGVLINGVIWAACNVDAFGTFAARPEDPGMFYQWNRPTAWPVTGAVTGWDNTPPDEVWDDDNDPCPEGWHMPVKEDMETLDDENAVSARWQPSNDVKGCRFTDKTTESSIFLPAAGHRRSDTGESAGNGMVGYYRSATYEVDNRAWCMAFFSANPSDFNDYHNMEGYSIRCVRE